MNSILGERYSEYFGFTSEEVRQMAEYYEVPEKFQEICDWYDGYRFGNAEIFNPWSVIGYFDADCEAEAYWISTSSNDIIGEILEDADEELQESLKGLVQGKTVTTLVDTGVVYPELRNNMDSIYSFLLVTGYLKIVSRKKCNDGRYICEVAIPNKDVLCAYQKELRDPFYSKENIKFINESMQQIKEGKIVQKTMEELEAMETDEKRI